ncbi:MAG: signal recognition particle protein [Clostridia bacterium]|nr:signal recognition particle protein [Clostridia bacterium]
MFQNLVDKMSNAFKLFRSKGKLTENDIKEGMREIKLALLEADVNFKVVKAFIAAVSERALGADVLESLLPAQQIVKIVNDELIKIMGESCSKLNISSAPPTVVLMCGLQGSGKTTHSAKLAAYYKKQGKRPLLVACDVYRPAAVEQLCVLGKQLDIPVYFEENSKSPVEIAQNAVSFAKKNQLDMVFIDTAGRLHIDEELMAELVNIKEKTDPAEILLVIDAMIGQDAVNVAKAFNDLLSITGVVLSKMDGDTRGGAALSVRYITEKPIKFIGTGEKLDAIEVFYPDRIASRILGMGDVMSIVEKAQQAYDEKKALELEKKMREQTFTLEDFLEQFSSLRSMGPLDQLLGAMPGVNPGALKDAKIDEKAIDRVEAIILSMTPEERTNPAIIQASRKKRIATGCGMKVEDVNKLLKQYDQMKKMMKQMSNGSFGKFGKFKLPF